MADVKVEELLDDVVVRPPSAARVHALGGRRRARRRAAGAVAAVAMVTGGALAWEGLPGGGGDGRDVRSAVSPRGPSIVLEGMPRILPADEVPGNGRWQWQAPWRPVPLVDTSGSDAVVDLDAAFTTASPAPACTRQPALAPCRWVTAIRPGNGGRQPGASPALLVNIRPEPCGLSQRRSAPSTAVSSGT
ncbi:hypothetical protein [Streptomyces sp. NRRL B-1347]|uniref:hypothetical protein n=1 Tax=Streptomyces sp. NRRL B-1347 TaxID=1476877 RepID=UPI0004C7C380|nr:hypothetical protein [Streptomyces sp. NRRL B-1347]